MNVGGLALVFAAVIAGGGGGAQVTAAHDPATRAQSSVGGSLSPSGTTGILTQTGPRAWQVRVLMDDSMANCTGSATYRLTFTVPGHKSEPPLSDHSVAADRLPASSTSPTSGSSCEMTVTFSNAALAQVPVTAALDVDQAGTSSAITLTVSRNVTLYYYLGLPAIAGGVIAVIMFLFALWFVRLYDARGFLVRRRTGAYWARPLAASGAWTLNDSWATNITAVITVLAAIPGTSTATAALFPGVAVDRFVIVNIVAGGFVAVAPLAFGIFYGFYTSRNPGVTADAALTLPRARSVKLARRSALRLTAPTPVVLAPGRTTQLAEGTKLTLAEATTIVLGDGITTSLGARTKAAVPAGAAATLADSARLRVGRWSMFRPSRRPELPRGTAIHLPGGASVAMWPAEVYLPGDGSAELTGDSAATLRTRTAATGPDGYTGTLRRATPLILPTGTVVTSPPAALVRLAGDTPVTFPGRTRVRVRRAAVALYGLPPWPARVTVPAAVTATLVTRAARLADVAMLPAAVIALPSGADLALPGGATVTAPEQPDVLVELGHTVHVPPQTRVEVLAGAIMTVPGTTSDITVSSQSTLVIDADAGELAIAAADIQQRDGEQTQDATRSYPVWIEAPAGAKLSVAGTADLTLPAGTISKAPYRPDVPLLRERGLEVPQGTNVLFGNLRMILATAVITMFGIGAELGIAAVLAYGLSEASLAWRSFMLAVTGLVAILAIIYAVTAIRSIADPRPGSSLSSAGGTSFTL